MVLADALRLTEVPGPPPTALVANLPYNVSVPVLLHLLERFPSITTTLVMVQAEVAQSACDRVVFEEASKRIGGMCVKVDSAAFAAPYT